MKIKGREFATGKPVICVPVVEKTAQRIIEMLKEMTARGVEMIEWRMDWYEDVTDLDAVSWLLQEIHTYIKNTIFLCTFRSKKQGGALEISQEDYSALNQLVSESGVADCVDVEFFEIEEQEKVIAQLKKTGVKVICSNHNFQLTPDTDEMKKQLTDMVEAGADFAKLAVMPQNKNDVLRLMEAVLQVKEQNPNSHLIAMSMGSDGVISRLLGSWYQSEITFAAFGKASAPGQVSWEKAAEILGQIEECVGK